MKRTLNIPQRAAYSISQPLYDALQEGCDQIEKQSEQFKVLRDQMQCIHIAQQPHDFDGVLQSVLDSCLSSLQFHISIFQAVVDTVKPEAGKEASKDHEQFVILLSTLKGTAEGYDKCKENTKKQNGASTSKPPSESSSSDSEFHEAPEVQKTPKANLREPEEMTIRKKLKTQHDSIFLRSPEPVVPPTQAPLGKPTANKGKKKKTRSSTTTKNDNTSQPTQIPNNDTRPTADTSSKEPEKPRQPSFEDISGEVEARLAAKAEKRKSKRESKKRKRESIASSIFSPEPEVAPVPAVKEKTGLPPKKRVKTDGIGEGGGEAGTASKRRKGKGGETEAEVREANVKTKKVREGGEEKKSNTSKRRHSAAEDLAPAQKETESGHRKKRKLAA